MADQTSDDDLVIIGETLCSREPENGTNESVSILNCDANNVNVEDDLSEECQIVENNQSEDDFDDLIVLDESVESGSSNSLDSDSGQLEVVAEVPRECCREAHKQISELQKFVKKLEEENLNLRAKVLNLPHTMVEVLNDATDHSIKVSIHDKELHNKYSSVIEAYIKTLLESEKRSLSKSPEATTSFFVDKYSHSDDKELDVGESWSIPLYDRVTGYLHSENESIESGKNEGPYYGPTCFNCDGNHMLSVCPVPPDPKKISQNRRHYNDAQQKSSKRYHLNSKYGILKPGEISEELRSALDLKPFQVPLYIYRMRVLGYPPGWLKEAEVHCSGLNLYDSDGKIVVNEDNIEEGEVDPVEVKVEYDPTKLINFEGFNMPLPQGFKDEHREYKMPSLQMHQLRCELEKSMKLPKVTPYKKRRLSTTGPKNSKRQKTDRLDEDMEIEITHDGVDVVDVTGNVTFSTPKSINPKLRIDSQSEEEDSASVSSLEERRKLLLKELEEKTDIESSPSLAALEERKQILLNELENKSDNPSDIECGLIESVSDGDSQTNETAGFSGKKSNGVKEINLEGESVNSTEVNIIANGDSNRAILKRSVSITPGTPVVNLKSKLPDSSQFAKGVSEHIPFENLPSSTGTYEKMRSIIDKTRKLANSL